MSATNSPSNNPIFEAPGPGHWERDAVHSPHPMSLYFQETAPPAFIKGTRDFARFYGMLIDGLEVQYVNGFGYNKLLPAPEAELPERFKRVEQVFAQKLWREQLRDWDENLKPAAIAKHRELQSLNPDAMSDNALIDYLKRCRDHHAAMITQHMRFTGAALVPTGNFLAFASEWTGLSHSELLDLMRGFSTVSSGGSDELDQLKRAFAQDSTASKTLESSGDAHSILESLGSLQSASGEALRNYLDLVGNRLIDGFDITQPTALELPDALLSAIRLTVKEEPLATLDIETHTAKVHDQVPTEHQAEFDALLEEARLTYRIRDERGVYSDIWASGIMRRAALAAGRRLASKGRIADPLHILDAKLDEMCALVAGAGGPSADELSNRATYRATASSEVAPLTLGSAAPAPPDLSTLPPLAARMARAIFITINHVFSVSDKKNEEKVIYGIAASKGCYEGPARRVSKPSEFDHIVKGDVLVTESTTEAFNILLPLLGGIVTDNGGLLSHAAIVSREYGIPGVVGTREGSRRITDNMRIRVDGDSGEVTILK